MNTRKCTDCSKRFAPSPGSMSLCPDCTRWRRLLDRIHNDRGRGPTEAARRAAIHRGRVAGLRGVL